MREVNDQYPEYAEPYEPVKGGKHHKGLYGTRGLKSSNNSRRLVFALAGLLLILLVAGRPGAVKPGPEPKASAKETVVPQETKTEEPTEPESPEPPINPEEHNELPEEPEEPKPPEFKGEALTSLERFDEIRLELERTISDIARNMRCGVADAHPLIHKEESPCDYCEMSPVCRVITKNKSSDESSI
jgi:hypothetical protein